MAILDEAKVALRLSTNDSALIAEVQRLIDEAVLDLTRTADIKEINLNSLDAYEKGAIISYCKWKWYDDAKFETSYNDYKTKMLMSYAYRYTEYIPFPTPPIPR